MQGAMVVAAAGALTLTAVSVLADRRRAHRRDIEAVGWVPWPLVTILGTIATIFAFAITLKLAGS